VQLDSRISLYKLEVFCRVVELGGVTRAAERLYVAQPAVSAHIRSLEDRLGVKLFDRVGHGLRLTETGQHVYRWASEIAARSNQMEREIDALADGSTGSVTIAASMSAGNYILANILATFAVRHPEARITMLATDPQQAADLTQAGLCDFALIITDELGTDSDLATTRLRDEEFVLVAGSDGEPAEDTVSLEELVDLPFVCPPAGTLRRRMEDRQFWKIGISSRKSVIELGHPEAMKTAAQQGLGVAMLLLSAVRDDLERGTLRHIKIEGHVLSVPLLLLMRHDKHLSPVQQKLYDAVEQQVITGADGFGAQPDASSLPRHLCSTGA
jgi:DNA-binding transcriptional LysR family regulator